MHSFAAPFHRSSKWLAARCLLASRFLVFFLFGVVLARPFFPIFRQWIPKRCKGVPCVDLGESIPTRIYLQKSASIQPRTSPSKFGGEKSIQYSLHSLMPSRRGAAASAACS